MTFIVNREIRWTFLRDSHVRTVSNRELGLDDLFTASNLSNSEQRALTDGAEPSVRRKAGQSANDVRAGLWSSSELGRLELHISTMAQGEKNPSDMACDKGMPIP